jgi:signal peptidase I
MEFELAENPSSDETTRSQPLFGRAARLAVRMFLCALLVVAVFVFYNFQSVIVQGNSMLPTFQSGTRIFICKAAWLVGAPKDNDIVVVKLSGTGEYIIKRVYRVAGERVDPLWSPLFWRGAGAYLVPEGQIYLLGDNREISEDSRIFGPVDVHSVVGKAVFN